VASLKPLQIREVFHRSSQPAVLEANLMDSFGPELFRRARDRIDSIEYRQYADTVVNFLGPEDRTAYDSRQIWDEIRLRVLSMLEESGSDSS